MRVAHNNNTHIHKEKEREKCHVAVCLFSLSVMGGLSTSCFLPKVPNERCFHYLLLPPILPSIIVCCPLCMCFPFRLHQSPALSSSLTLSHCLCCCSQKGSHEKRERKERETLFCSIERCIVKEKIVYPLSLLYTQEHTHALNGASHQFITHTHYNTAHNK